MISTDKELPPIQVIVKVSYSSYYSKKFATSDAVIPFCLLQRSTEICYHPFNPVLNLGEDSTGCHATCICIKNELTYTSWVRQSWS